jgi:dynein light intermediate chain
MPGPPLHSLVKYDTPSLLTTKGKAGAKKGAAPAKGGKKQLPPVEAKPQVTQTEDILNSILPPR